MSLSLPSIVDPRLRASLRSNIRHHYRTQVRVPYKKLIEKYATEFFSSSVLCTMGESIDALEGRKECHMEEDIFVVRAKEANEKKKAEEKAEKPSSARTVLASSSSSSA